PALPLRQPGDGLVGDADARARFNRGTNGVRGKLLKSLSVEIDPEQPPPRLVGQRADPGAHDATRMPARRWIKAEDQPVAKLHRCARLNRRIRAPEGADVVAVLLFRRQFDEPNAAGAPVALGFDPRR